MFAGVSVVLCFLKHGSTWHNSGRQRFRVLVFIDFLINILLLCCFCWVILYWILRFYFLSLSTNPGHGNLFNNMVSTLLLFLVEFPILMIYHQTVSSFCFLSLITNVLLFTLKCFLCETLQNFHKISYDLSSSAI